MASVREVYDEAHARLKDAVHRERMAHFKHEQIEASADADFYREVKAALRRGFKTLRNGDRPDA